MLTRRLHELVGMVLIGLAGLVAISLATWTVQDPSFNHAGAIGPVRNWLGFGGAAAADFLMQIFGVASVAVLTPIAFWGWRLLAHKAIDARRTRLICLGSGILLAAGFASGFPVTMHWPLPTGLGGVAGDWAFGIPAIMLFLHHSTVGQGLLTILLGAGAFLTLAVASGFFFHHEEIERPAPENADAHAGRAPPPARGG